MSEEMSFSSSDKPVAEPKQDIFGYAHFSKTLADSLTKMKAVEGLVVAINGPWGCGKTSVINFIKHYLFEEPEDKRPYVLSFNPWLFTGQEDLIQSFLSEMLSELAPYTQLHNKLKNDLSTLAGIFSKGAKFIPIAGDAIQTITDIAKEQLEKRPSLQKTKDKVSELLEQEKRNIIVFIDDIDRLSSEEIRHLFGAIKSVANFPNVLYVLAFDEEVVRKALSKTQDMDGMAYIEKIVQMPFKLPLPESDSLFKFFSLNIDKLLKTTEQPYVDIQRWQNFYRGMFAHFLRTPRAIIRLLNTLRVTYPVVENEVNVVDFVAIEMLRVFVPQAYDLVREDESRFVLDRTLLGVMMEFNTEAIKQFHESWLATISGNDKDAVEYCISHLFPNVADTLSGNKPEYESREWRRKLRICSREHFPKYFKLAVPSGGIANTSFQLFLDNLHDSNYVASALQALLAEKLPDGTSKAAKYLDYILDHVGEHFRKDKAIGLIEALFDIGDSINIETDHDTSFIGYGTEERIRWILYACCEKLDDAERRVIHRKAYANGTSLSTKTMWLALRFDEHDEEKRRSTPDNKPPLLPIELLEELKVMILSHISEAARSFRILDEIHMSLILYEWKKFLGPEVVDEFIGNILKDDTLTLRFIKGFSSVTRSASQGEVASKSIHRIRLDWMKDFIDVSKVFDRAKAISAIPTDNDDELRRCYEQFMKEYDAYIKGKRYSE